MHKEKLDFLKYECMPLMRRLDAGQTAEWGMMNPQQMVEHVCDALKNASGKLLLPRVNEGTQLEKSRQFLQTEKPFAKNIANPLMGSMPQPLRKPDLSSALDKMEEELHFFFQAFETNPGLTTHNPFFGELDYAGNVSLLYKHILHHLRQFGLI